MIAICDGVERLVHCHALLVPIVTEADHKDAMPFRFDRFVNIPATGKVEKEIGHGGKSQVSTLLETSCAYVILD